MTTLDSAVSSVLAAQQGQIETQIAYAVAGKVQDTAQLSATAATTLLEDALEFSKALNKGQNFDIQV